MHSNQDIQSHERSYVTGLNWYPWRRLMQHQYSDVNNWLLEEGCFLGNDGPKTKTTERFYSSGRKDFTAKH